MTKEQAQDYIKLKYKMITGKDCGNLSNEAILAYLDGYDQAHKEKFNSGMDRDKACTIITKRFLEDEMVLFNQEDITAALLKAVSDMYKMAEIEDIVSKSPQDVTNYMVRESIK